MTKDEAERRMRVVLDLIGQLEREYEKLKAYLC